MNALVSVTFVLTQVKQIFLKTENVSYALIVIDNINPLKRIIGQRIKRT